MINAPFLQNLGTKIKVKAPPHAAGTVDVTVTTTGGTSPITANDKYTYVAPGAFAVSQGGTGSGSVTCNGGACLPTYPFGTR